MEAKKCESVVVANIDEKKLKAQTVRFTSVIKCVMKASKLYFRQYNICTVFLVSYRILVALQPLKATVLLLNGNNTKLQNFQSLEVKWFVILQD